MGGLFVGRARELALIEDLMARAIRDGAPTDDREEEARPGGPWSRASGRLM